MPLVGQGPERLGKNNQLRGSNTCFTGSRCEADTLHADEVADIELRRHGQRSLIQFLGIQIDLHPSANIGEVEKTTLAHIPIGRDAPGKADGLTFDKAIPDIGHSAAGFKSLAKGIDSLISKGLKFLPTEGDEFAKGRLM